MVVTHCQNYQCLIPKQFGNSNSSSPQRCNPGHASAKRRPKMLSKLPQNSISESTHTGQSASSIVLVECTVTKESHRAQCQRVPFNSGRVVGQPMVARLYMRHLHLLVLDNSICTHDCRQLLIVTRARFPGIRIIRKKEWSLLGLVKSPVSFYRPDCWCTFLP